MSAALVRAWSLTLAAGVVAVCVSFAGPPQEIVACGEDSGGTFSAPDETCEVAFGFSSMNDACRAARLALKQNLVGRTDVNCDSDGCTPWSCQTAVRCPSANCAEVTTIPGSCTVEPLLCFCEACWDGSDYGVACTACE